MEHEKLQELLALDAIGVLEPVEQALVEAHLASGCTPCIEEHRNLSMAAAELAFSVEPVTPPQRVRDAVLRAAMATGVSEKPHQIWKTWASSASHENVQVVRAAEGDWSTVMTGVEVKRLSFDATHGIATMLVRMAPGASYPSHRHAHAENCYVLEGDLSIGEEIVMHAGDFQHAESGSIHIPQTTRDGCLLLITSSTEDELLV